MHYALHSPLSPLHLEHSALLSFLPPSVPSQVCIMVPSIILPRYALALLWHNAASGACLSTLYFSTSNTQPWQPALRSTVVRSLALGHPSLFSVRLLWTVRKQLFSSAQECLHTASEQLPLPVVQSFLDLLWNLFNNSVLLTGNSTRFPDAETHPDWHQAEETL